MARVPDWARGDDEGVKVVRFDIPSRETGRELLPLDDPPEPRPRRRVAADDFTPGALRHRSPANPPPEVVAIDEKLGKLARRRSELSP
jgi:hypothetical protein